MLLGNQTDVIDGAVMCRRRAKMSSRNVTNSPKYIETGKIPHTKSNVMPTCP